MVFKNANIKEAKEIWNRVEKKFHEENYKGKLTYKISLSVGFVEYNGGLRLRELIEYVDKDMYEENNWLSRILELIRYVTL